jgi:hypothetical protein
MSVAQSSDSESIEALHHIRHSPWLRTSNVAWLEPRTIARAIAAQETKNGHEMLSRKDCGDEETEVSESAGQVVGRGCRNFWSWILVGQLNTDEAAVATLGIITCCASWAFTAVDDSHYAI